MSTVRGRANTALAALVLVFGIPVSGVMARELAHGRPVRWSVAPNYDRCTDPQDSLQLTDGKRAANAWIWLDRRTVGWQLHVGDHVELQLDLGRDCRLDSIVVSTAVAPRSEVLVPSFLVAAGAATSALVEIGARDGAAVPVHDPTGAARIRLVIPVHGHGRHLLVAALLREDFLFIDELEVYGDTAPPAVAAAMPGRPLAIDGVATAFASWRRLWAVRAALPEPVSVPAGVSPEHEEQLRLRARAARWRAATSARLRVRRVDPWAPLTPWTALHPSVDDTLRLWPGAWAAAAIDVAWSDSVDARLPIRVGEPADGGLRATPRIVVAVEARDGRWAGDALPLAGDSLWVRSGAVQQLWIDVEAQQPAMGNTVLEVRVGSERVVIPVRVDDITVADPPFATLDWTYPSAFGLPRTAPEAAIRDNRDHGIDSWCLPDRSVPWPTTAAIGPQGRLEQPPDYTACDREVQRVATQPMRWLGWYLDLKPGIDDPSRGRFRYPYLSAAWKAAFLQWLDDWQAHLSAQGIDRRRVYLQPFDETTDAQAARFYDFLHRARPDLPLALTLTRKATPDAVRDIGGDLGIAVFEREALPRHAAWIRAARARGVEVWVYDVLEPSKAADPTRDYRLLAWEAWARALTGCGFWAYGDTGEHSADAWNDFDGAREDFAVVYGSEGAPVPLGGEAFAPSKRWQAFRIGVQETRLFEAVAARRPALRGEILQAVVSDDPHPDTWRARCIAGP